MDDRVTMFFFCSEYDRMLKTLENNELPPKYRDYLETRLEETMPMDYRNVYQVSEKEALSGRLPAKQTQYRWFKTRGTLDNDPRLHNCVVAYASDSAFIGTAAMANGLASRAIGMMASLDHSMWFHAPVRADEW